MTIDSVKTPSQAHVSSARAYLIKLHAIIFLALLLVWYVGVTIKSVAGSPFVALYYVLHIFPACLISLLILVEWISKGKNDSAPPSLRHRLNHRLHQIYYRILLILPITGITCFFDFLPSRPFYLIHAWLFYCLLILIGVNVLHWTRKH